MPIMKRSTGTAEDVDEALWALQHLKALTILENLAVDQEAVEKGLTGRARAAYQRDPGPDWVQANECAAEALSYISEWQEIQVRAQV